MGLSKCSVGAHPRRRNTSSSPVSQHPGRTQPSTVRGAAVGPGRLAGLLLAKVPARIRKDWPAISSGTSRTRVAVRCRAGTARSGRRRSRADARLLRSNCAPTLLWHQTRKVVVETGGARKEWPRLPARSDDIAGTAPPSAQHRSLRTLVSAHLTALSRQRGERDPPPTLLTRRRDRFRSRRGPRPSIPSPRSPAGQTHAWSRPSSALAAASRRSTHRRRCRRSRAHPRAVWARHVGPPHALATSGGLVDRPDRAADVARFRCLARTPGGHRHTRAAAASTPRRDRRGRRPVDRPVSAAHCRRRGDAVEHRPLWCRRARASNSRNWSRSASTWCGGTANSRRRVDEADLGPKAARSATTVSSSCDERTCGGGHDRITRPTVVVDSRCPVVVVLSALDQRPGAAYRAAGAFISPNPARPGRRSMRAVIMRCHRGASSRRTVGDRCTFRRWLTPEPTGSSAAEGPAGEPLRTGFRGDAWPVA